MYLKSETDVIALTLTLSREEISRFRDCMTDLKRILFVESAKDCNADVAAHLLLGSKVTGALADAIDSACREQYIHTLPEEGTNADAACERREGENK